MGSKKKCEPVWPQYIENSKGKKAHVYLPIEVYQSFLKAAKKYEVLQREKGVAWVRVRKRK